MLKVKPTFIEENGKPRFVVFSMRDFRVIREALEDAADVRLIEEAKRRNGGKPGIPHEQVMREFGLARAAARKRGGRKPAAGRPGRAGSSPAAGG